MARFRVETIVDPSTGLIYAECYFPEDAKTPFVTTNPIYTSHEQAEEDIIATFKQSIDDK